MTKPARVWYAPTSPSGTIRSSFETTSSMAADPSTSHGVHWGVTTASIPGDTRAPW